MIFFFVFVDFFDDSCDFMATGRRGGGGFMDNYRGDNMNRMMDRFSNNVSFNPIRDFEKFSMKRFSKVPLSNPRHSFLKLVVFYRVVGPEESKHNIQSINFFRITVSTSKIPFFCFVFNFCLLQLSSNHRPNF